MKISACYIVKNEEKNLRRSLESLKGQIDELVVVDTGSTDGTKQVAAEYGASLFDFAWQDDFAAARNFALEKVSGDYIVFLDADEYFSAETAGNLRRVIEANRAADSICLDWYNYDEETGKRLGIFLVVRLFANKRGFCYKGRIHEQLVRADGGTVDMVTVPADELLIMHTGYSQNVSRSKGERNLRLLLQELERAEEPGLLYMYLAETYDGLGYEEEAAHYARLDIAGGRKPVVYASRSYRVLLNYAAKKGDKEKRLRLTAAAAEEYPELPEFQAEYAEAAAALFAWERAAVSMEEAARLLQKGTRGFEPTQMEKDKLPVLQKRLEFFRAMAERARRLKISACVITKNEEKNIGRWLEAAKATADEIVVVDTGSTDKTIELAEKGGARIEHFAWCDDFAAAKNYAINQCHGEWIIFLDADEYFSPASAERLRGYLATAPDKVAGIICKLVDIDTAADDKVIGIQGQIRIFRRRQDIRYAGSIHEFLRFAGDDEFLSGNDIEIYHTGYSAGKSKEKARRNLALLQKDASRREDEKAVYLMDCYFDIGDKERTEKYALMAIDSGIRHYGMEVRPYEVLLTMYINDSRTADTERIARRGMKDYPAYSFLHFALGLCLFQRMDFLGARKCFEQAIYLETEAVQRENARKGLFITGRACLPIAREYLAQCCLVFGEEERAEELFSGIREKEGAVSLAVKELAGFYQRQQKGDAAALLPKVRAELLREAQLLYGLALRFVLTGTEPIPRSVLLDHLPRELAELFLLFAAEKPIPPRLRPLVISSAAVVAQVLEPALLEEYFDRLQPTDEEADAIRERLMGIELAGANTGGSK